MGHFVTNVGFRKVGLVAVLASIFAASGCAHVHEESYLEQLAERPLPVGEAQVRSECGWIRSEIARMQSISASASGQFALVFQAMARNNIAGLESRAANVRCASAFSSQPLPASSASPIQQCVAACKANTSRTSEQCFDSCNH
jgi:hypothetical protein